MYSLVEKTDSYLLFEDGDKKVLVPTSQAIIVDDESDVNSLKTMSCRKTILTFTED